MQLPWKKKVVQKDSDSDEEAEYELKPRKVGSEWIEKKTRLPIKLEDGTIEMQVVERRFFLQILCMQE